MYKKIIVSLIILSSVFVAVYNPVHAHDTVVRDIKGNPVKAITDYIIHVYRANGTDDFYMTHNHGSYQLMQLTTNRDDADPYFCFSEPTVDGFCSTIMFLKKKAGSFQALSYVANQGIGHHDSTTNSFFGFLRVSGDRDYKYLLLCNKGVITANFSERKVTANDNDELFLISFEVKK